MSAATYAAHRTAQHSQTGSLVLITNASTAPARVIVLACKSPQAHKRWSTLLPSCQQTPVAAQRQTVDMRTVANKHPLRRHLRAVTAQLPSSRCWERSCHHNTTSGIHQLATGGAGSKRTCILCAEPLHMRQAQRCYGQRQDCMLCRRAITRIRIGVAGFVCALWRCTQAGCLLQRAACGCLALQRQRDHLIRPGSTITGSRARLRCICCNRRCYLEATCMAAGLARAGADAAASDRDWNVPASSSRAWAAQPTGVECCCVLFIAGRAFKAREVEH